MGFEYNNLGEECESRKANHKRGNLYGLEGGRFLSVKFCAWKGRREKERELGAGATMEGEIWSELELGN